MLYREHLAWEKFQLTTLVVIDIDCIWSYKSNYHTITTKTTPKCTLTFWEDYCVSFILESTREYIWMVFRFWFLDVRPLPPRGWVAASMLWIVWKHDTEILHEVNHTTASSQTYGVYTSVNIHHRAKMLKYRNKIYFTFRYIDAVISLNNSKLGSYFDRTYLTEMEI